MKLKIFLLTLSLSSLAQRSFFPASENGEITLSTGYQFIYITNKSSSEFSKHYNFIFLGEKTMKSIVSGALASKGIKSFVSGKSMNYAIADDFNVYCSNTSLSNGYHFMSF